MLESVEVAEVAAVLDTGAAGLFLDCLVGEVRPGLVIMGGACNCCTNELFDPLADEDPPALEVLLRPLSLSKTVLRLFLLTV